MRKLLVLFLMIFTTAAYADELAVSGDIAVYNQYVARGLSYSAGKPVVQGDVVVDSGGLSSWVWFSNAYPSPAPQYAGRDVTELDWGVDYSNTIGAFAYSIGGTWYTYQFDSNSNYPEAYIGLASELPFAPAVTAYFTLADSNNKAVLSGDIWAEATWNTELNNTSLSTTLAYAYWAKNAVNRPIQNVYKNGLALATVGISRNIAVGDLFFTPSLKASIPLIGNSADENQYIYGLPVTNEVTFGFNLSY